MADKVEDIFLVKLITGEQFVSEVYNVGEDKIGLRHPLNIVPIQDPSTGQVAISLQPMLLFTEEESVTVDKNHVIWTVKAEEKLVEGWNDTVNPSEIIQPKKPELIF